MPYALRPDVAEYPVVASGAKTRIVPFTVIVELDTVEVGVGEVDVDDTVDDELDREDNREDESGDRREEANDDEMEDEREEESEEESEDDNNDVDVELVTTAELEVVGSVLGVVVDTAHIQGHDEA